MGYEFADVTREGVLTIVTINRPESYNALHAAAHRELDEIFDQFERDDSQWLAIITGMGPKAFCAGQDLKHQASADALELPPHGFAGLTARPNLAKPLIAAVNGVALGGGLEIALACDIVVAAEHAAFALPEPRVGLAALAGGMQRLPLEIGLKRAMGLMLTGRRLTAREGFELGFVNEVVEGDVLEAARRWAAEIQLCSPMSIRATKQAAMRGLSVSTAQGMAEQWEYPAVKAMFASEDVQEGPKAFSEKRMPQWTGAPRRDAAGAE